MGKKKAFIDKKSAVTYNLIYRSTEAPDDAPERLLVEAERGIGIGRPDADATAQAAEDAAGRRYGPNHPLAWLEEESAPMSEDRRRENIEYGFPDDGYDYLRHTRKIGHGRAALEVPSAVGSGELADEEAPAGPSVFLPAPHVAPPSDDVKVFDATRLLVHQAAEDEEDATQLAGGVTAFTRERDGVRRQDAAEVAALDALMRALERDDGANAEEWGDLEEDFVLAATAAPAQEAGGSGGGAPAELGEAAPGAASGGEQGGSDGSGWGSECGSDEEEGEGSEAGPAGGLHGRGRSIASTYWRPERHDRSEALSVIDERFERLALEYEDDELGDLEEEAEDIAGESEVAAHGNVLERFLDVHGNSRRGYEAGTRLQAGGGGEDAEDLAAALAQAKARLRQYEEEGERGEGAWVAVEEGPAREAWDCESVLTKLTNTDNHPGRIDAPRPRRAEGKGARGQIVLSELGVPVGYAHSGAYAAAAREGRPEAQATGSGRGTTGAPAPPRRKGESAEEKRERKAAVKGQKREARVAKKELKEAFKQEGAKMKSALANATRSAIPIA